MAPKYHPTPLSGGDRKALKKELGKARAMAGIFAAQSVEMRAKGEALIQQADKLLCESWNERMWSDGEPIDPSPTIDQAINGGFPWLEIQCARCKTPSDGRPGGIEAPTDDFRARSCQPIAVPEVRQDGAASVGDLAPAWLAAASRPSERLEGCDDGRNHRLLLILTMNGHPRCRPQPAISKPSIPSNDGLSNTGL